MFGCGIGLMTDGRSGLWDGLVTDKACLGCTQWSWRGNGCGTSSLLVLDEVCCGPPRCSWGGWACVAFGPPVRGGPFWKCSRSSNEGSPPVARCRDFERRGAPMGKRWSLTDEGSLVWDGEDTWLSGGLVECGPDQEVALVDGGKSPGVWTGETGARLVWASSPTVRGDVGGGEEPITMNCFKIFKTPLKF